MITKDNLREQETIKEIKHILLPGQKSVEENLEVTVTLHSYTRELYKELIDKKVIDRIKEVPQLGLIEIEEKRLSKSRFDYIVLQLYLHEIVNFKINSELEFTYGSNVNLKDFMKEPFKIKKKERPSIGELLQILTIVYNIGHFYNTFTSSKAVLIHANENKEFAEKLIKSSKDERFQEAAEQIIETKNYHRFHLLNSLLVLERCNQDLKSIRFAQEMLYEYINKSKLSKESKLNYIFRTFQKVRDISYIAYDLRISRTSLKIDLYDKDALEFILEESLSFFKDQKPTEQLFKSLKKLLDGTIYNESSNAIYYHQISKKMVSELEEGNYDYFDLWRYKDSILNSEYKGLEDYSKDVILNLTFTSEEIPIAEELLLKLERTSNIRVGWYNRFSNKKTIIISIKKYALNKKVIAFKVLRIVFNHFKKINTIASNDVRFLFVTKFFFYYFFKEKKIVLKSPLEKDSCVIFAREREKQIKELENILNRKSGTNDEKHEVRFLKECLQNDTENDTAITVPSRILIVKDSNETKNEFDGMIIYPNRKEDQIIFLEAKNTRNRLDQAKEELVEKLINLDIDYNEDKIKQIGRNAMLKLSI